jgi:hypothetical protein
VLDAVRVNRAENSPAFGGQRPDTEQEVHRLDLLQPAGTWLADYVVAN